LYIYVDESNHAITNNKHLCKECYIKTWGEK